MRVVSEQQELLDAEVSFAEINGVSGLVVESRGGATGGRSARNVDYATALEVIFARLASRGVERISVRLASSRAIAGMADSDRLVWIDGESDLRLSAYRPEDLRLRIGRAVREMGQDGAAKGGNSTKRLQICADLDQQAWVSIVSGGAETLPPSESEVEGAAQERQPISQADERDRIAASIAVRRGQAKFRNALIQAYEGRCAVTGSTTLAVLEAAHILPYRGGSTNQVRNGILLRADVHTLFDLGLLGIDADYRVVLAEDLRSTEYWGFNGECVRLPVDPEHHPDKAALAARPIPRRHR